MVEIHKGNKWRIIGLTIAGVVFIVIGVVALIAGAVFITIPSEDPEDRMNFKIGLGLLLFGGPSVFAGIISLLTLIAIVCCLLTCYPEVLAQDPNLYDYS